MTTTLSPAPSAPRTKTLLTTLAGPRASREVTAEITRLETVYLKAHQRRLPIDLFVSSSGYGSNTAFSIIAHHTPEQEDALAFLQRNVGGAVSVVPVNAAPVAAARR